MYHYRMLAFVWILLLGLMGNVDSLQAQSSRNLQVIVYDSAGKIAFEGISPTLVYPFQGGIVTPNPKGLGALRISFDQAVECSFVRIDRHSLTALDIEKIRESALALGVDVEEHLTKWPLRIKYVLANGKVHIDTSAYGTEARVVIQLADKSQFELKAKDFGKLVIKR